MPRIRSMRKLEAIRKAGASVQEIVLAPLGLGDVGRLIADALHCERDARRAAGAAGAREDGRQSVLRHPVPHRARRGEACSPSIMVQARWSWDLERIQAKGFTDNVVDLMVGKLTRLPGSDPGGAAAARLPGQRRGDRHPEHGQWHEQGSDGCGALGGGAGRAGVPAGRAPTGSCTTASRRRPMR